jgi:hypothetical protein
VDSIAVYKGYLMPLAAGTLTAPALELPFFDAQGGAVARAALPGQTLQVAAGAPAAAESRAAAPETAPPAPARDAAGDETAARHAWQAAAAALLLAWLITLGLWWRQASARRSRRKKSGTLTASARGHPLKQALLEALGGARTLEQGLRDWEDRYGVDGEVRAAVRAVQRLCYQPGPAADEPGARVIAERAIRRMRRQPPRARPAPDAWSPQAFRPHGQP